MKLKKIVTASLSIVLTLTTAITASAYDSTSGSTSSFYINNKTYKCYSETVGYSTSAVGVACVSPNSASFRAGEVGGQPKLYTSSGTLKATGNWEYCPSNTLQYKHSVTYYTNSGSYYTISNIHIWVDTSASYTSRTTNRTPNLTIR